MSAPLFDREILPIFRLCNRSGTPVTPFTVPRSATGAPGFLPWALFSFEKPVYGNGMAAYSDDLLRSILTKTRRIAVVGVSANPVRPSYYVARYLNLKGYTVLPVNPGFAGEVLFGQKVAASLSEIDGPVDMVDIFRRSDAVPPIVDEALAVFANLQTIWMQIGVEHEAAAQKAQARGVTVIQNRCPKIEYQRLFGELRMGGFNTGVISSRL